jgi:outer membrane protein assembly factor BamB
MRCRPIVISALLVFGHLVTAATAQIPAGATPINVLTHHNDNGRTGLMQVESLLTLANVNSATFGKLNFLTADGKVDGEPLYVSNVNINSAIHNVVYLVTEHDSIYAFDADTGQQLWKTTALLQGETSVQADVFSCSQISPEIGITDTPVIDRNRNAIYFVGMSIDVNSAYHQRLHALDLASGGELFGGPREIQATYPGTGDNSHNGVVIFDPKQYAERVGLLELNGRIHIAFTSHCDHRPYTGWVMQYDASTLQQLSVLNLTPNGNSGSIWQSGAGLAADNDGYMYLIDGDGTFDTTLDSKGFPVNGDYGNAMLKLSTAGGLAVADYFSTYNTVQLTDSDLDLGSGGALVLPDVSVTVNKKVHLVIAAAKDGNIYVADRDNMGKWNPNDNNNLYQQITAALPNGEFSMPAYFHNTVYFGGASDHIKAYPIVSGRLATSPSSQTAATFNYPGTTPSISANLSQNGILWALQYRGTFGSAILHAYNALDLTQELYNSDQQGRRDQFGPGTKFTTLTIANGRVYVPAAGGVAVFGLLQSRERAF